jgi:carbon-monoxide dehydrogenase medium subunit
MGLPPFDYVEPDTLGEAVERLRTYGEDARIVAGGTTLVLMLRYRFIRPAVLVSLSQIPELHGIRGNGDLRIGALATHREIERSPEVAKIAPLLGQAASRVGSPAIRNMGTIGGNLAYGEAASDPAPALLALDARVTLAGPDGERTVPLDGFFKDFFETDLRPGEILTAVHVPPMPTTTRSTYIKYTCLSEEDRALVSVAALVVPGTDESCARVRIGLGGVARTPVRAKAAEEILHGQTPTPARIAEAAEAAAAATDPLDDRQGSAEYRRDMTRLWVRRALEELTRRRETGSVKRETGSVKREA